MKRTNVYVQEYLAYRKGCGLSRSTLHREELYMRRFTAWLAGSDLREVTRERVMDYLEYLRTLLNNRGELLKFASIRCELGVINEFFGFLYKNDYLLINPVEDIKLAKRKTGAKRKIFSEEELSMLLDSIGVGTTMGQRNRSLFELMYASGLRVNEVVNMKVEDVNLEERICYVKGKGNKDRFVPFSQTARDFLLKYMERGRLKLLGKARQAENKEYLFLNQTGKKISWKAIRSQLKKQLAKCGLQKMEYTIHSIRHATATHLLQNGAGIRYVQELLGHATPRSTEIYTRPTVAGIKKAYSKYHPRDNEFKCVIDGEYLREVNRLKEAIIRNGIETEKQQKREKKRLKKLRKNGKV